MSNNDAYHLGRALDMALGTAEFVGASLKDMKSAGVEPRSEGYSPWLNEHKLRQVSIHRGVVTFCRAPQPPAGLVEALRRSV